jgi:HrpA-like RNA helicase
LPATGSERAHRFDPATGEVRATLVERYRALPLNEQTADVDPIEAADLLRRAYLERGPGEDDGRLLRRLAFAGRQIDLESVVREACRGITRLADVRIEQHLPGPWLADLDRAAPERLAVPSGRRVRLEYRADGTVSAAVKLQELFGLAETPRIGPRREPVVFELLAPNGRPVQVTRDLRSFWERGYPEVRRELRGRYPRHPWPEDPWIAPPAAGPSRRRVR